MNCHSVNHSSLCKLSNLKDGPSLLYFKHAIMYSSEDLELFR